MNKSDLVDYVAAATNEGKSKVASLLEALLNGVTGALQKGDKVTLPGFGTFQRDGPQRQRIIDVKPIGHPCYNTGSISERNPISFAVLSP